ncbi:DUF4362 domain-containing protein [Clostridium polynesiense]|uniref:DUF4362 domain-containing protein n=1 Tax=Clostridium polynesiense TaxID=1325933 RepID=UPI000694D593|nr:DUF4362 domain-containing protein [Clostridium polynesiense]
MLFNRVEPTFDNEPIDAVIDSIKEIDNKLPVWRFFENVFLNKPDSIKIVIYNIEGEPAIKKLNLDGEIIKYTYISDGSIKEYMGNGFKKTRYGSDINYDLYQNDKFIVNMIAYTNYDKLINTHN